MAAAAMAARVRRPAAAGQAQGSGRLLYVDKILSEVPIFVQGIAGGNGGR